MHLGSLPFAKYFFKLMPIRYEAETKAIRKLIKFWDNANTGQSYSLFGKCNQYWRYTKKYFRQIALLLTTTTGWSCQF